MKSQQHICRLLSAHQYSYYKWVGAEKVVENVCKAGQQHVTDLELQILKSVGLGTKLGSTC